MHNKTPRLFKMITNIIVSHFHSLKKKKIVAIPKFITFEILKFCFKNFLISLPKVIDPVLDALKKNWFPHNFFLVKKLIVSIFFFYFFDFQKIKKKIYKIQKKNKKKKWI